MQLFARVIDQTYTFELQDNATVGDLKALIQGKCGLPVLEQVVSANSSLLDTDELALSQMLSANATVDVVPRLLGGKVHGSLARAGKVRGQTPKVDKQEKKKKKVGRARRRMQYNRRFVNVQVSGPGRRKGPNSNS